MFKTNGHSASRQRDLHLLQELKAGQPQAVQRWFTEYHPLILRFILSKVESEKDAEELAQETFIHCLQHLPLFRGEASILTWMQGIARHEVADYYRKFYAKKAIKALPLNELIGDAHVSDAHETSEKVKRVFRALSHEHQELLLLKYVDGKKVSEIARELGRSVKAIESDLFRARQTFKTLYAQQV